LNIFLYTYDVFHVSLLDISYYIIWLHLHIRHVRTRDKIFIERRYWYSNSLRPSVGDVPLSDENGLTYGHSFFHHTVAQSFKFYRHQTSSQNSDEVTPCGGTKYRRV